MATFPRRLAPAALLGLGLITAHTGALADELPNGAGGVGVGARWPEGPAPAGFEDIAALGTDWDRFGRECGYRALRARGADGMLLVTVHDFVVTEVSHTTPIEPGTDLIAAADGLVRTYGQPERAAMRDLLGNVTIDRDRANHVALEYAEPRPVRFDLSGRELWQAQVRVSFEHGRWHENRNWRCARAKQAAPSAGPNVR